MLKSWSQSGAVLKRLKVVSLFSAIPNGGEATAPADEVFISKNTRLPVVLVVTFNANEA